MILSAPFALLLQVWFSIWLPTYATTRLSDLTWGNRERTSSLDESDKALARARNGQKVGWLLIASTVVTSIAVILLMQINGLVFSIYVLAYTLILSSSYLFSFFDLMMRLITCHTCDNDDPAIQDYLDDAISVSSASTQAYVVGDDSVSKADALMEQWKNLQQQTVDSPPERLDGLMNCACYEQINDSFDSDVRQTRGIDLATIDERDDDETSTTNHGKLPQKKKLFSSLKGSMKDLAGKRSSSNNAHEERLLDS